MAPDITATMSIARLTQLCDGVCTLSPHDQAAMAGTIWMDSRKIGRGDIFVALRGEGGMDGHAYVGAAQDAGAAAAIVSRRSLRRYGLQGNPRLIMVSDPLAAVHKAARRVREERNIPVIAVTGSNGKTTTRRFIAQVLSGQFKVGETCGNWNNHIGVPLSILRFDAGVTIGVLEMGANHSGEISKLSKTAAPDVAVITNIGYAHVGNFGSLEQTCAAKFEIADGLHPQHGFMLLNGDDRLLRRTARQRGLPARYFGLENGNDLQVSDITVRRDGSTAFIVDGQRYRLAMPGRHFIYNALPAIFLARWFGMPDSRIAAAIAAMEPDALRGRIITKGGVRFIVDCYNANPSSMRSALSLLQDVHGTRRMGAVLGDMLELGSYSAAQHRLLGRQVAGCGADWLVAVGTQAPLVAAAARRAGMSSAAVHAVQDATQALEVLRSVARRNDTVLLKGSRAVGLESVFERW